MSQTLWLLTTNNQLFGITMETSSTCAIQRLQTNLWVNIGQNMWYKWHKVTLSWPNGALKSAFRVSVATDCEFLNSENFSALPVPSPLNRAVDQVSRPNGCPRRAFVTCALYYNDIGFISKISLALIF